MLENYDRYTEVNTDGVCELFGITPNTVTKWVAQGKIPSPVKFGKTNKWLYVDLLACKDMMFAAARKNVRNFKRAI